MPAAMLTLSLLALLAAPPAQPTDTKVVLLLDDLSVVEAEPAKDGYAIRRGKALDPVPRERVKFVGDSRAAVHQYLLAQAATALKPPPAVGYAAGTLPLFAARVQPVLVNRCAACHAKPEYAGAFKLARTPAGFADPEATERNARSAAFAVDRQTPAASPLLVFAATAHGGAKAAPLERSHPAFQPLAYWVALNAGPATPAKPITPPAVVPVRPATAPTADPTDPGPFNRAVHHPPPH